MEDHLIIDLFWERSETAITETAHKYEGYCRSIANNILHNQEDTDECINDTYMSLWNSVPPQKPSSLRAYLARIARNHALNKYTQKNALKRGAKEQMLIFDELADCISSERSTEALWESRQLTALINSFLRTQSREIQTVFVKRYWYSDSIQAISSDLNISESKVKSMLFRCRGKLKEHLQREGVPL
ncbi:MAG: sigma-70 family RNA polymerase sigma factor [Peptococcaceae bacterium]|nr:sigma-70 family RNA polymerase sigma factor [Peptococcaceae bacterium]